MSSSSNFDENGTNISLSGRKISQCPSPSENAKLIESLILPFSFSSEKSIFRF